MRNGTLNQKPTASYKLYWQEVAVSS